MNLIHSAFEPAAEERLPTIVAFHGWGASALDLLGLGPYVGRRRLPDALSAGPARGSVRSVGRLWMVPDFDGRGAPE